MTAALSKSTTRNFGLVRRKQKGIKGRAKGKTEERGNSASFVRRGNRRGNFENRGEKEEYRLKSFYRFFYRMNVISYIITHLPCAKQIFPRIDTLRHTTRGDLKESDSNPLIPGIPLVTCVCVCVCVMQVGYRKAIILYESLEQVSPSPFFSLLNILPSGQTRGYNE